jgi:hypothetical protein
MELTNREAFYGLSEALVKLGYTEISGSNESKMSISSLLSDNSEHLGCKPQAFGGI